MTSPFMQRLGWWLLKKQEPLAQESVITLSLLTGILGFIALGILPLVKRKRPDSPIAFLATDKSKKFKLEYK
jgi:hypothetical protein